MVRCCVKLIKIHTYTKAANVRLGAEINMKPFILRSGYSKYGSALANKDFSRENFSFGLGLDQGRVWQCIRIIFAASSV